MHKLAHGTTLTREEKPLFKIDSLSYNYPSGPFVLREINLSIYKGDRLAIVGANGSGKSTLAKHLNGLLGEDNSNSKIQYKERPLNGRHLNKSRFEIGLLFQDPDDHLFCNTLYDDVAFGPLNQGKSQAETKTIVEETLNKVNLFDHKNKPAHFLSYGQKKRAALAAILAMQPSTLILDEPTVNLDTTQIQIITKLLQNFHGTLICISHDLFFLKDICQRALVLEKGTIHHNYSMEELMQSPSALREHGLDFSFRFSCCGGQHHHGDAPHIHAAPHIPKTLNTTEPPNSTALLQFNNFSFTYPNGTVGLKPLNLTIHQGERVALLGENGAGKSTLAGCLTGILTGEGDYLFQGTKIRRKNRKKLWKDVGIIFQDSADQLFCATCWDEVAFGLKQRKIPKDVIKQKVHKALAMVHLTGFEKRVPLDMSGGERKRLAIASVICLEPKVLIMDEPTAGLDPQGEEMFLNIIQELHMAQILISHDPFFIAQHCPRAIIMDKGTAICECPTESLLDESFLRQRNIAGFNLNVCELKNHSPYSLRPF